MGRFVDDMITILEGMIWTNYGSTPRILKYGVENRSLSPDIGIMVREDPADLDEYQTFALTIIAEHQFGFLTVWTTNSSDRNKLEADLEAELPQNKVSIKGLTPKDRTNLYELELRVERLD